MPLDAVGGRKGSILRACAERSFLAQSPRSSPIALFSHEHKWCAKQPRQVQTFSGQYPHFQPAVCPTKRDERGRPAARSHCRRQSSSLSNRPRIAKPNTKSTGHNPDEKKSFATRGWEVSLPVLLPVRRGRRAQSGTRASKKQHPPSHLNLIGEQLGSGAEIRARHAAAQKAQFGTSLLAGNELVRRRERKATRSRGGDAHHAWQPGNPPAIPGPAESAGRCSLSQATPA